MYSIEVKSRKVSYKLLDTMMEQAEKAREFYLKRGEGDRIPIGIYHVVGSPLDKALVYFRLADFELYVDPLLKAQKLMEVQVAAGLQLS